MNHAWRACEPAGNTVEIEAAPPSRSSLILPAVDGSSCEPGLRSPASEVADRTRMTMTKVRPEMMVPILCSPTISILSNRHQVAWSPDLRPEFARSPPDGRRRYPVAPSSFVAEGSAGLAASTRLRHTRLPDRAPLCCSHQVISCTRGPKARGLRARALSRQGRVDVPWMRAGVSKRQAADPSIGA